MSLKPVIGKSNTLGKNERLKSRKLIGQLFKEGRSLSLTPFRALYQLDSGEVALQTAFSVSSKNFRKAVDRNRIKRLMREAYRTCKHSLQDLLGRRQQRLILFVIYTGKEVPYQALITEKMNLLLQNLVSRLGSDGQSNQPA